MHRPEKRKHNIRVPNCCLFKFYIRFHLSHSVFHGILDSDFHAFSDRVMRHFKPLVLPHDLRSSVADRFAGMNDLFIQIVDNFEKQTPFTKFRTSTEWFCKNVVKMAENDLKLPVLAQK